MKILNEQIRAFLEEPDMIASLANISSLIFGSYDRLNWAGFYFVRNNELVLGPFQGRPACMHIPFSKGVCGRCFREKATQMIDDVHQVQDHIACDAASRSELCVPVIVNGECVMEIDIDSPEPGHFNADMKKVMEQAAADIAEAYVSHHWSL